jgi:hypothetical protein
MAFELHRQKRILAFEASGGNLFNILPNNYVLVISQVPNQASFPIVNQKVSANSEKRIVRIDDNALDA